MAEKKEKRRFFYNVPKGSPMANWCESQDSFTNSINWLIKSVINLTGSDQIDIFDYLAQPNNLIDLLSHSSKQEIETVHSTNNIVKSVRDEKDNSHIKVESKEIQPEISSKKKKKTSKKPKEFNSNNFKDIPGLFDGTDDFN